MGNLFNIKTFILATTMVVFAVNALSKEVYKYKDENGNWQFSDVSSGLDSEDAIRIEDSRERKLFKEVWVREVQGTNPSLIVVNNYFGPVQVNISVNCSTCEQPSLSRTMVAPARGEMLAAQLQPKNDRWQANYDLAITLGNPNIKVDENHLYQFPFQELVPYMVTQSFNGSFSHKDDMNLHAIDVAMPISKPVLAARGGIVMAIEEDNQEAGLSPEYADKANTIYILHSDGTIGVYAHLDMYSALVIPGQNVSEGDYIGRSGNTGFSSGPHLHFTVWRNQNGVQKTVPFQFNDGSGVGFVPYGGETITHGYAHVKRELLEESQGLYQLSIKDMENLEQASKKAEKESASLLDSIMQQGRNFLDTLNSK